MSGSPDLAKDLLVRQHMVGMPGQVLQQLVPATGQTHFMAVAGHQPPAVFSWPVKA